MSQKKQKSTIKKSKNQFTQKQAKTLTRKQKHEKI